jgi:hypothetical protein
LHKIYIDSEYMESILEGIPDVGKYPLHYIFEDLKLVPTADTLWLEFGVATGRTINYFSQFTKDKVYGFDSFEGLPEKWRDGFDKGAFSRNGDFPEVNANVVLIKGWFSDTLVPFLKEHNKKVSFLHIDCDLYSSTKFIFNAVKDYLAEDCVILFDELVNYPGYKGETGELLALYEFVKETNMQFEWIGMNGFVGECKKDHVCRSQHEKVALRFKGFRS